MKNHLIKEISGSKIKKLNLKLYPDGKYCSLNKIPRNGYKKSLKLHN